MSGKPEDKLAGATLYLKQWVLGTENGQFIITATLSGSVANEATGDALLKRMTEGLMVFSDDNFHLNLIDFLGERVKELEEKTKEQEQTLQAAREKIDVLEKTKNEHKEVLNGFINRLRDTRPVRYR